MTSLQLLAGADRWTLLRSLLAAACAFAALALLADRFTRIAEARPVDAGGGWSVPAGQELTLRGLAAGTLLDVVGGAGEGANLEAQQARVEGVGPPRRLLWMVSARSGGDHRLTVRLGIPAGGEGAVALRSAGEADAARIELRNLGADLRVETGIAVGESRIGPDVQYRLDGAQAEAAGSGPVFTLPRGGTLALELPALAGERPLLGGDDGEAGTLALREVAVTGGSSAGAVRSACSAPAGSYAILAAFRPALSPAPAGADCGAGHLEATRLTAGPEAIVIGLAGSAFLLVDGKPTASFWSWAMGNPVLEYSINKALPMAVSGILALVTFRRGTRPPARRKAKAKPKPKAKAKGKPSRGAPAQAV